MLQVIHIPNCEENAIGLLHLLENLHTFLIRHTILAHPSCLNDHKSLGHGSRLRIDNRNLRIGIILTDNLLRITCTVVGTAQGRSKTDTDCRYVLLSIFCKHINIILYRRKRSLRIYIRIIHHTIINLPNPNLFYLFIISLFVK